MPELEPLGLILGVLFTDESSDYILRVLSLAGVPTHFDLTQEEAYSHKTRKRAYQKRLAPILASFSEAQRRRIGENIARELRKDHEIIGHRLLEALANVGWTLQDERLVAITLESLTVRSASPPEHGSEAVLAEGPDTAVPTPYEGTAAATGSRPLGVFLCHASADKPAVRDLNERLLSDGMDPWLDEEDLLPGHVWDVEIKKAVRTSDVVLVCLSERAISKAGYVQKEVSLVLDVADEQPEGAIFLIPVKLEPCEIPARLSRWHWVNLFEQRGYEKLLRALRARSEALGRAPDRKVPEEVIENRPPEADAVLIPKRVDVSSNVVQLTFKLHNGRSTLRPTRIEVGVPKSWLWSFMAPSQPREVLEVDDRPVGDTHYQYKACKRVDRTLNHRDRFTPLPSRISPGEIVDLPHLIFDILAGPSQERHLPLRYRIYAEDVDLPERTFSLDELLSPTS